MTGREFKDALCSLGMTQRAFARLVHMPDSSITRYVKGTYPVPHWAVVIVDLLREQQAVRARLLRAVEGE